MSTTRDVYLRGCGEIAAALAGEGFTYTKSYPKVVRKRGDWRSEIRFSSNRYNDAAMLVELWIDVVVYSKRLAAWRKHQPPWPVEDGCVGGLSLACLSPELATVRWNLLHDTAVAEAVGAIRQTALPYCALLEDPEQLAAALLVEDVRGIQPSWAVDALHCFVGPEAARRYTSAVLARHPDVAPRVRAAMMRARAGEPPAGPANVYEDLGIRLVRLGLEVE